MNQHNNTKLLNVMCDVECIKVSALYNTVYNKEKFIILFLSSFFMSFCGCGIGLVTKSILL